MKTASDKTALVIGGSMGGLLAARVLSGYYQEVIIVERDVLVEGPEPRKGVPQAHQPHVFLLRGLQTLETFFPGMAEELVAAGARYSNIHHWCFMTPAGRPVPVYLGDVVGATRGFLEWHVRKRVASLPNIRFVTGVEVSGLTGNEDRSCITGVHLHDRQAGAENTRLAADLVVDASGRYSKAPVWLKTLGYPAPPEDVINVGIGYSSRMYRKPDHFPATWQNALVQPQPPHIARMGVLLAVEDNRWHVMMGGAAEEYPPADEQGFLEWARTLANPCIYEAIRLGEPLTPVRAFRTPETRFRHFERLSRWPEGLLVMGDAVCAFNPIYGQGVTVAAMQAEALSTALQQKTRAGWEKRFQRQASKIAAEGWMIGSGEDLRWSDVLINGKPAGRITRLMHRYIDRILLAACVDAAVSRAFFEVMQMLKPSAALMHPRVVWGVLSHALGGSRVPAEAKQAFAPETLLALQARPGNHIQPPSPAGQGDVLTP